MSIENVTRYRVSKSYAEEFVHQDDGWYGGRDGEDFWVPRDNQQAPPVEEMAVEVEPKTETTMTDWENFLLDNPSYLSDVLKTRDFTPEEIENLRSFARVGRDFKRRREYD